MLSSESDEDESEQVNDSPISPLVNENMSQAKSISNLPDLLNDTSLSLNSFLVSQFEILYNYFLPTNAYIYLELDENDIRLFHKQIKNIADWKDIDVIPNVIKLLKNHNDSLLIENNLNENSSILPFYENSTYSPGSVFSMCTEISNKQFLYWIFDTPANGFFNEEELKVPIQVSSTVQYVLKHFVDYSNQKENNLMLERLFELNTSLNISLEQDSLITAFVDFISREFEAHKLTIALVDESNQAVATIVKSIGQMDPIKEGTSFVLVDGLCGKVILSGKTYLIDDIEKDGYFIPRFSKTEKTNYGLRSFLAVPIKLDNQGIGMISIEHKMPNAYSENNKKYLKEYTSVLSSTLPRFLAKKKGES